MECSVPKANMHLHHVRHKSQRATQMQENHCALLPRPHPMTQQAVHLPNQDPDNQITSCPGDVSTHLTGELMVAPWLLQEVPWTGWC